MLHGHSLLGRWFCNVNAGDCANQDRAEKSGPSRLPPSRTQNTQKQSGPMTVRPAGTLWRECALSMSSAQRNTEGFNRSLPAFVGAVGAVSSSGFAGAAPPSVLPHTPALPISTTPHCRSMACVIAAGSPRASAAIADTASTTTPMHSHRLYPLMGRDGSPGSQWAWSAVGNSDANHSSSPNCAMPRCPPCACYTRNEHKSSNVAKS